MNTLIVIMAAILNFAQVDSVFDSGTEYENCRVELQNMLPLAANDREKCEVLWRLSRVCLMLGESRTSKEDRREEFSRGVKYAEQAIAADPKNPSAYMWHCANVGRECQTHSLPEQAKSVPVMMDDLTTILRTLGRTDFSEAWQALSEVYWNHPFKSDNDAISYARRAVLTIPGGELRLVTYLNLAKMLVKRDYSVSRRLSEFKSDDSIPDRAVWSDKKLTEISDREEAAAILKYASEKYKNTAHKTAIDRKNYEELTTLLF